MSGKRTIITLTLLFFIAVCFMTGPAVSGEHPWDSDTPSSDIYEYGDWHEVVKGGGDNKATDSTDSSQNGASGMPTPGPSDGFFEQVFGIWTGIMFETGLLSFSR